MLRFNAAVSGIMVVGAATFVAGCPGVPSDAGSRSGEQGAGGAAGAGGRGAGGAGPTLVGITSGADATGGGGSPEPTGSGATTGGAGASTASDAATASGSGGAGGGAPQCVADAECDDALACTVDQCVAGACASTPDDSLCQGGACDPVLGAAGSGCTPPPGGARCDEGGGGGDGGSSGGAGGAPGESSGAGGGRVYVSVCIVRTCQGKTYDCGDCLDNDADGLTDDEDDHCLGPCDNTETSFHGGIPGQANAPCKQDCYFDKDSGAGNDECHWSHECDGLAPEPAACSYDPSASIPGYGGTCEDAAAAQSASCQGYCGPLTPNGCDCFGCCDVGELGYPVWLGSEDPPGTPSCTLDTLADPSKCKPCTQVGSCLNTCEPCELCVGKPSLPPECSGQTCPAGAAQCGLCGQPECPAGASCITGCCQLAPM